jgi:hypothetical protein
MKHVRIAATEPTINERLLNVALTAWGIPGTS